MNYTTYGITTFPVDPLEKVRIVDVTMSADTIHIHLNDGRIILLEFKLYPWLRWLLDATPEQRNQWEIVPSGGGVWWSELDEGIELQPLLAPHPLLTFSDQLAPQVASL
jgi:hypothetical protein